MATVRELHKEAMRLAQLALIARNSGDLAQAEGIAHQAYQYEAQAAYSVPEGKTSEPTRSILFRSAASLAYQCKEFDTAQRLIAEGLTGYPPEQVEKELKDLYSQVTFGQYLQAHQMLLSDEDLRLNLKGDSIGFGTIIYSEFIKRVDNVRSLIDRTVQRLMGNEYQRLGKSQPFQQTICTSEGSFIITFRLAISEQQQKPLFFDPAQIFDEIITGMEFINNSDNDKLKKLLKKDEYYQHFIAMSRNIVPDGDRVNLVGLTTKRKSICVTRKRHEIELTPKIDDKDDDNYEYKEVKGILDFAESRKKDIIGLTTEDGYEHKILVAKGLDDFVKSYFKELVIVTGLYDGRYIRLTDIRSGESC
jgi:hypothetical protein